MLALVVVLAPGITERLPLSVMAGSILLIAWNLIDIGSMRHILSSSRSEAAILMVTLLSTLLVELEFAIYIGVLLSLAIYLRRTSQPRIVRVAPLQQSERRHMRNIQRYSLEECPQLKMIRVDGSLFFGAVDHVQQQIRQLTAPGSGVRHILLIGKGINFIDVAGVEMLHQEINRLERLGGKLMISSLKGTVMDELERTGALRSLGEDHFYETPKTALADLIPMLDQDRCASCTVRIFSDCPPPPPENGVSGAGIVACRCCGSVLKEVQHHAVELVSMFPLCPVAALVEDVQFRIGDTGNQTQAGVHRHKAIVAAPDDQCLLPDFGQTRAEVRELFGVDLKALDEVFQMVAALEHVVQTGLEQLFGQITGVEHEHRHHLLQVLDARITVEALQQLDPLCRHRREQTGSAGTAAHQH
jgi:Sulfate permease and related transporters (MFS superfamily)